jgi:hypothetical protein
MFKIAFAIPRFLLSFQNQSDLLYGIAEEPISPALIFCLNTPSKHKSKCLSKSIIIVLILLKSQKKQQNDRNALFGSWERVV